MEAVPVWTLVPSYIGEAETGKEYHTRRWFGGRRGGKENLLQPGRHGVGARVPEAAAPVSEGRCDHSFARRQSLPGQPNRRSASRGDFGSVQGDAVMATVP